MKKTKRSGNCHVISELNKYFNVNSDQEMQQFYGITEKNVPAVKEGFYDAIVLYRIPRINKEIDAEWFLTGKGEMLKERKKETVVTTTPDTIYPNKVELLEKENAQLRESLANAEERYEQERERFNQLFKKFLEMK